VVGTAERSGPARAPCEGADMVIHELHRQACIDLLTRIRLVRLACVHEGQPYITPIHCAYHENHVYGLSAVGQKITWMRANPLVCVEAEELTSPENWASVIGLGQYEELPKTPQSEAHRQRAFELLRTRPVWWEPACAQTLLHGERRPIEPVYFRIHLDQVSGRRGIPDAVVGRAPHATGEGLLRWLRRLSRRGDRKPE